MNYKIRPIAENEYSILEDFLYEAIFIPEGVSVPPKEFIQHHIKYLFLYSSKCLC